MNYLLWTSNLSCKYTTCLHVLLMLTVFFTFLYWLLSLYDLLLVLYCLILYVISFAVTVQTLYYCYTLCFLCTCVALKEASYYCTYTLYHLPLLMYPISFTNATIYILYCCYTATMLCTYFVFVCLPKKPVTTTPIFSTVYHY